VNPALTQAAEARGMAAASLIAGEAKATLTVARSLLLLHVKLGWMMSASGVGRRAVRPSTITTS
jgi:F420-0:gamma-glutamyl ligase